MTNDEFDERVDNLVLRLVNERAHHWLVFRHDALLRKLTNWHVRRRDELGESVDVVTAGIYEYWRRHRFRADT